MIELWPFDERLSASDGVKKYRRWLRRWLLGEPGQDGAETRRSAGWWHFALAGTMAVVLVAGLIWAAAGTWQPAGPAPQNRPGVELMQGPGAAVPASAGISQPVDGSSPAGTGKETGTSSTAGKTSSSEAAGPASGKFVHGTAGTGDMSSPSGAVTGATAYRSGDGRTAAGGTEPSSGRTGSPAAAGSGIVAGNAEQPSGGISLCRPVSGAVDRAFGPGYSEVYGDYRFNDGVEFAAVPGGSVKAAAPGRVKNIVPGPAVALPGNGGQRRPASYSVTIDHGNGWQTTYQGLDTVRVRSGQTVGAGEIIGALPAVTPGAKVSRFTLVLRHAGQTMDPAKYLANER
ncbi:peptidoglycan DD-metalloendopeptidase family protein [Desulfotomaculum copahuensis]|uniref:M23ase beta-sheet core domain-containing protein n=1 Tax=Desulfotomaculum copahuensis TaxID=1838280 RepID=A0A1B7LBG4_9FIRM|nr:peptidoglycan DD-metalloendopeptidase family protein [Desulfotomaculum copahuensis]OAT79789.1 hypothetical protein A6M21_15185 [Desulfotomaculum copahuensis]